ncbi:hypothetical protein COO60DRAFT_1089345 [Scenedesmus sp. NREL 46B-D3]|nr:hypothetical protein COO60DRAFT_1089345 [Scenedesmus sp. NREL 46B-D3]
MHLNDAFEIHIVSTLTAAVIVHVADLGTPAAAYYWRAWSCAGIAGCTLSCCYRCPVHMSYFFPQAQHHMLLLVGSCSGTCHAMMVCTGVTAFHRCTAVTCHALMMQHIRLPHRQHLLLCLLAALGPCTPFEPLERKPCVLQHMLYSPARDDSTSEVCTPLSVPHLGFAVLKRCHKCYGPPKTFHIVPAAAACHRVTFQCASSDINTIVSLHGVNLFSRHAKFLVYCAASCP